MDEFKLCSDGEFMPVSLPCPPPYSGPYYYYPYENIPLPPADQGSTNYGSSSKGGSPLSSGAVVGIIILAISIFVMLCLISLKFRRRFILGNNIVRVGSRNNNGHTGESHVNSGDMLVNIAGCGLEEKLVNLLPVCEYVGLMQEGKLDGKERHECAVCLSLFEEKEIVRVLPKCKHTFHVQCIDKWFESHANCPLCRERITLQTIQLCFHAESHDDQQPLGPALHQDLTLNIQNNADYSHPNLNDQHVSTPQLRHSRVQNVHDQHVSNPQLRHPCAQNVHDQQDGRPACGLQDLNPHQTIFLAAASATNTNNTHTAQPYQDQNSDHPLCHATGAHPVNDRKAAAGFTCRMQGLCDQNALPIPIPTAESMKYKHHAESKKDENSSNEGARGACVHSYIEDSQSAGPACGMQSLYDHPHPLAANDRSLGAADDHQRTTGSWRESNKIGVFLNPNSSKQTQYIVDIDDHKTALTNALAEESLHPSHDVDKTLHISHNLLYMSMISTAQPSSRPCNVLRKSLSTGSLDGRTSHQFYGATCGML